MVMCGEKHSVLVAYMGVYYGVSVLLVFGGYGYFWFVLAADGFEIASGL